ncbi:hypothetical protein MPTK1_8g18320 [Marchantia polymorpha subsp. ruderalis]|uniref:Uncharacterized protein n=1 Tax=Marchantia polymorpha TaxID=3197 RepID=A0A2R6W034_MARPO|nr:hypothetical protein MARPO_0213s0013 [Marchantia polymorpha]BBN20335.1 hypothetical protein Mp_8g18320 [Marchantia polymorpha subsp. ruderalis]|eukprot:PTQ27218.1 hypothetical protein MARPO_0213s0013 [Marchantia polymorpha]
MAQRGESDFSEAMPGLGGSVVLKSDVSEGSLCTGERRKNASCLKVLVPAKTEMCRYYGMPGGCVRGEKCFYAHGEEDLHRRPRSFSPHFVSGSAPFVRLVKISEMSPEDLSKKVFVGGLSPSVESDDLRFYFEEKFGPVMDAVVIGSQSGDQVQSRGFGFVTFKNEESVLLAVKTHYVNLFGKKVEIKGAVPRSGSSQLEIAKIGSTVPREFSDLSSEVSERNTPRVVNHQPSSLDVSFDAETGLQLKWSKTWKQGPDDLFSDKEPTTSEGASSSTLSSNSPSTSPFWLSRFKAWLPKFLTDVYRRLKDGEWYPLSSLKGDFRATCGLELDHAATGHHKLNEFIKCFPDLCKIRIVPVGLGPATHLVLLPLSPRASTTGSHQKDMMGSLRGRSVAEIRNSDAAAISHETANKAPVARDLEHFHGNVLGRSSGELLLTDSLQRLAEKNLNGFSRDHGMRVSPFESLDGKTGRPSSSPKWNETPAPLQDLRLTDSPYQNGKPTNPTNSLDFLLFSDNTTEKQVASGSWSNSSVSQMRHVDEISNNSLKASTSHVLQKGKSAQSFMIGSTEIEDPPNLSMSQALLHRQVGNSFIRNLSEEPTTPVNQVNLTPFSAYDNQMTPFFTLENNMSSTSNKSIWSFPSDGISTDQELNVQVCKNSYEQNSTNNLELPNGDGKAHGARREKPVSVFHAVSNYQDGDHLRAACSFGCNRQSTWIAMPCKHYALCSPCKNAIYNYRDSSSPCICPVCCCMVERMVALHR